jgi:hypothetical protein
MKEIAIAVCFDENYALNGAMVLYSAAKNIEKNVKIRAYIVDGGISEKTRYCQMLWMDKFTSSGTLTVTPLYPSALHPGIFYSLKPVESFYIPEAVASSFLPPWPV